MSERPQRGRGDLPRNILNNDGHGSIRNWRKRCKIRCRLRAGFHPQNNGAVGENRWWKLQSNVRRGHFESSRPSRWMESNPLLHPSATHSPTSRSPRFHLIGVSDHTLIGGSFASRSNPPHTKQTTLLLLWTARAIPLSKSPLWNIFDCPVKHLTDLNVLVEGEGKFVPKYGRRRSFI
jgi:hypothetical protein